MEEKREENIDKKAERKKIVFESEDGSEEFYVLEQTMLGGVNYILVTDIDIEAETDDADSEEGSFLILRESGTSEEGVTSYEIPEDDNELKAVITVFNELLEDLDLEV